MKTKTDSKSRKLALKKETVRELSQGELKQAAGGMTSVLWRLIYQTCE